MPPAGGRGETELPSYVEEEDEDDEGTQNGQQPQQKIDWFTRNFGDIDKLLAYQSNKMVRIKDRKIGILYWSIVTAVIMYIIIVAINIEKKHTTKDSGIGTVITRFKGKAFSTDGKVYDPADLRYPVIEPNGAFIMTRRLTLKDQQVGVCLDWDSPTRCPCQDGQVCNNGFCQVKTWCPSLGDYNVDNPPSQVQSEEIRMLENCVLQIQSGIAYPNIGNYFYVTGHSEGATNRFNNITLGALLELGDPPIKMKDLLHRGALIGVSFFWNCDVTSACEPQVVIKRLDVGQGFVQKRARHRRKPNGDQTRDALYMFGIRFVVDSAGVGQRFSIQLMVIQVGSALALLRIASAAADNIMLSRLYVDRQEAYYKCKVKETEDYSEAQERINLIKDEQKRSKVSLGALKNKQGAGAKVNLGLGAGGRGGMPAAILRGRTHQASSSSSA